MFCLSSKGGYQSPAIGAWSYAIVLQLAMGLYIFYSYNDSNDLVALHKVNSITEFSFESLTKFQIFGLLHISLALCTAIPFLLGHLLCKCFLLPMMIFNYVQSSISTFTTGICGYFLQTGARSIAGELNKINALPTYLVSLVYDEVDSFAIDYRENLFTTGIISFIVGFLFRCAASHSKHTDHVTSMIAVPTLALGYAVGFATLVPTIDTTMLVIGSVIIVICTATEFVIHFSQCRTLKFLNAILLLLYSALGATSLYLWIYTSNIITSGHVDFTTHSALVTGKLKEFFNDNKSTIDNVVDVDLLKAFLTSTTKSMSPKSINFMLDNGCFTLCIVLLSGTTVLYSIFSAFYSARDIFSFCSPNQDDDKP